MTLTRETRILSLSSNRIPFYLWVKAVPVLCHPENHVFNITRFAGTWLESGWVGVGGQVAGLGSWLGAWKETNGTYVFSIAFA